MNTPSDRDILETLAAAMQSGRRLAIPAAGSSMGPAFREADAIVVQSADAVRVFPGRVIVYQRKDRWIAHRVVWVFRAASEQLCVTKGDGVGALDRPFVRKGECVGVVVAIQRGSRTRDLTTPFECACGLGKVVVGLAGMLLYGAVRRWRAIGRFEARRDCRDGFSRGQPRSGTPIPPGDRA